MKNYIRYVCSNKTGFFQNCYLVLDENNDKELENLLLWFGKNLPVPPKFIKLNKNPKTNSDARDLCWFKASATKHLNNADKIIILLKKYDITAYKIETNTPGFISYKDDYQIAAIPFKDRLF